MIWNIVSHTPVWIWGLLAFLIWLGLSQSKDRQVSVPRTFITPAAMIGLSIYGMVSVFGASPLVWSLWLLTCTVLVCAMLWLPTAAGCQYDRLQRRFKLPGSWIPMVVIMCIFCTKYSVGISLALSPSIVRSGVFTTVIPLLYGAFSGLMLGRSAQLIALMQPAHPSPTLSSL
jgi:hypothetical protein